MNESDWKQVFADWERSGLSQAEYCRQRQLSVTKFGYWRRRLSRKDESSGTFIELSGRTRGERLELELANGVVIRVPRGFERETLRKLLSVVQ